MTAFVEQHQVRPVVSAVFPLQRAGDAFDLMEQGGQFGKIVVKMGG
jgi:NADPH:quinone reductase-like Zn-dependent oxidoreductase